VTAAIEAHGFGWTYRGSTAPALRGVDLVLGRGEVLLVLGPSGSGKSTLALAIAGLVPHAIPGTATGTLVVDGLDTATTPAPVLGDRVGIVFQDPASGIVLGRVSDEVAFGLENRGWPLERMRARVPAALALAGLSGFEERGTAALSGGEQQRLAIAGALAAEPSIVVLDEPTANLDPPGMASVFARLADLVAGRDRAVVVVEHRLDAVLPFADRVLVLDGTGGMLAEGPPAEVGERWAADLERMGAWIPTAWRRHIGRPFAVPDPGAASSPDAGPAAGRADPTAAGARPTPPVLLAHPVLPVPPVARVDRLSVADPTVAAGPGRRLLADISFEVHAGERVALVGPNGAGKSSLLLALAGILRPSSGTVRIASPAGGAVDPARLRSSDLADSLALVFQEPEIAFVGRTVRDEVAAGARLGAGRDAVVDGLLDRFDLARYAARDPRALSRGEQRRLSVAAACVREVRLLLLDEPTYGMDRRATDDVVRLLDAARRGGAAQVLATHDPRLLPSCDRVVGLDSGRIVFDGTVTAFLEAPPYEPPGPWRSEAAGGEPAFAEPAAVASDVHEAASTGEAAVSHPASAPGGTR
jgi:energy-coupling factor transporter ATP-binding protein EcfA2